LASAPSQRIVTAATFGSLILPCFTAINSATMLTAISCGVMAPMSRPIGAWIPSSDFAATPSSTSASKMR
jgi:hypothetical protein